MSWDSPLAAQHLEIDSPTSSITFPFDVLTVVLAQADHQTLRSLSCASKDLFKEANKYLWRAVMITNKQGYVGGQTAQKRWMAAIDKINVLLKNERSRYTRKLDLKLEPYQVSHFTHDHRNLYLRCATLLQASPRLKCLRFLEGDEFPAAIILNTFAHKHPFTLEHLTYHGDTPSVLLEFLVSQPNIRRLSMRSSDNRRGALTNADPGIDLDKPTVLPHLQAIRSPSVLLDVLTPRRPIRHVELSQHSQLFPSRRPPRAILSSVPITSINITRFGSMTGVKFEQVVALAQQNPSLRFFGFPCSSTFWRIGPAAICHLLFDRLKELNNLECLRLTLEHGARKVENWVFPAKQPPKLNVVQLDHNQLISYSARGDEGVFGTWIRVREDNVDGEDVQRWEFRQDFYIAGKQNFLEDDFNPLALRYC